MYEHLRLIKDRGYPTEVSKSLLKLFDQSADAGVRGMIGRVLGEYRLAKDNWRAIVLLMIEQLKNKEVHYWERKRMAQGLGYLLKPKHKTEIKELAEALEDKYNAVRKETIVALGRIKPKDEKDIEEALIEIAVNPKEKDYMRKASISALGEIINPGNFIAIWKIYELLMDVNPDIQKAASSALKQIDSNIYSIIQSVKIQELYQRHIEKKDEEHYPVPKPFGSWYEVHIFLAIHKKGYFVIPQFEAVTDKKVSYRSRPYRIDFVIIGSEVKKLAVEFDGSQHENEDIKQKDKERQKQLENIGWEFWRIKQRDFTFQPDQTLEELWKKLDEMEIKPISETKK